MVDILHKAVKGRGRYKIRGLYRSRPLQHYLERRLSTKTKVRSVSVNILTGNVLVLFDPEASHAEIAALLRSVVSQYAPSLSHGGPRRSAKSHEFQSSLNRKELRRLVGQAEEQPHELWHLKESGEILTRLGTHPYEGLSAKRVREQFTTYGPNVLPETVPPSGWQIFFNQLNSFPVAMLGVAAGISFLTGGLADAAFIGGVVGLNAAIGYATESSSEQILFSLRKLVRPLSVVIREGCPQEIGAEEVVPGDLITLKPGSYVSADARVVAANRLTVDESVLTGESLAVHKVAHALSQKDLPLGDRRNMVYMGTLVTGGEGRAVAIATGRFTEIGKIQALVGETESPETPMERQLGDMGRQLVMLSLGLCGLFFVIGVVRGQGLLPMMKSAISLAVAAVPEGLPTVATTTLALGINRMRRQNVLVRRLSAIETLGCIQTICLDKTGTLTENRMTVAAIYAGGESMQVHEGRCMRDNHILDPSNCGELWPLLQIAVLCNDVEISREGKAYILRGSSTETALLNLSIACGVDLIEVRAHFPRLALHHRSEKRNVMSSLHRNPIGGRALFVKGNPAEVLPMCRWYLREGKPCELTEEVRFTIQAHNEGMAGQALRILGLAYGDVSVQDPSSVIEQDLIWVGLVGMADPIREGVKDLIRQFHHAGIETVMVTGDQSSTAYAIAKELGLNRAEPLQILESTQLSAMAPEVVEALSEKVQVFARVSPSHKLQIVQALQRSGKIVAMTGDGINDGPALKAADIGIAMGVSGTDVAREVGDVVLEDDRLETMIIAVSQGRTIYSNIRKSVHFLLSTNLSEIEVMFAAILMGIGQPLNPMQLLWINLLSDVAPGLALALEPPEPDVLSHPPRNPQDSIITRGHLTRVAGESLLLSAGALSAYGYGLMKYGQGSAAGTLCFTSLSINQLVHALNCRSEYHGLFDRQALPPNPYLSYALAGSLGLQLLTLGVPRLRTFLGLAPLSLVDGVVAAGSVALPYMVNQVFKRRAQ
jgi:P-type Ca2+ transporter type 2C